MGFAHYILIAVMAVVVPGALWAIRMEQRLALLASVTGILSVIIAGAYSIAAEAGQGVLSWLGYVAIGCATCAGVGAFILSVRLSAQADASDPPPADGPFVKIHDGHS